MRFAAAAALGLIEGVYADVSPGKGRFHTLGQGDFAALRDPKNRDVTDELYDLVAASYAKIGGHANVRNADDIPGDSDFWKIVDVDADPDPDLTIFGKTTARGRKMTGFATDGSSTAKAAMFDRAVELLNKAGNYSEVSGALAHVLITRYSVPFVGDHAEVERVLGKRVRWIGADPHYPGYDGWYEREIAGSKHAKILVGRPR